MQEHHIPFSAIKAIHKDNTMKTVFLIIIFITLFFSHVKSQTFLYDSKQYCRTDQSLKEFLNQSWDQRNSSKYILYIQPSLCPRCEGVLYDIAQRLKPKVDNKDIYLVVNADNIKASKKYMAALGFEAFQTIYDTGNVFSTIIQLDIQGRTTVPTLLTFDWRYQLKRTIPTLGINLTDGLIDSLIEDSSVKPCIAMPINVARTANAKADSSILANWSKVVPLKLNESYPYSEPFDVVYSDNKKIVSFIDKISKDIFVYTYDGDFIKLLRPTNIEYEKYSKTALEIQYLAYLRKMKVARAINLRLLSVNETGISVVSSLPKIECTITNNDTIVKYDNVASIVHNDLRNRVEVQRLYLENTPQEYTSKGIGLLHKQMYVFNHGENEYYIFPIRRGWPAIGTMKFNKHDTLTNPFLESFYDYAPAFAIYKDSTVINTVGKIADIYVRKKIGYYATSYIFAKSKSYLFSVEINTGLIERYEVEKVISPNLVTPNASRYIFDIDFSKVAKIDYRTFSDKIEYFKMFSDVFDNYQVLSMTTDGEYLYVLCKMNNDLVIYKCNFELAIIREKVLSVPAQYLKTPTITTRYNEDASQTTIDLRSTLLIDHIIYLCELSVDISFSFVLLLKRSYDYSYSNNNNWVPVREFQAF